MAFVSFEIDTIFDTVDTVIDFLNFDLLDLVRASRGSFGFEILNTLGGLIDGAFDILGVAARLSSNPFYWSASNGYFDLFEGTTFETLGEAINALDADFFYDLASVFDPFDLGLLDTLSNIFKPVGLDFLDGLVDVLNRLDLSSLKREQYNSGLLSDLATIISHIDDLESLSRFVEKQLIEGSTEDDWLNGLSQNDLVLGLVGDDTLWGRGGQDLLNGGSGGDLLRGMGGADVLVGDRDGDRLYGGASADILLGGSGVDWLWGGVGSDTFVFELGQALDIVKDFVVGKDILQINLDDLLRDEITLGNQSGGAVLRLGDKRLALLEGIDATNLVVEDIIVQTPRAYG